MSNHLALATVTASMAQILQAAISADVSGATVTTAQPNEAGTNLPDVGVNLFLYQVTPNVAWRSADLPTRSSSGQLTQRPRIALDLHYLLTFYGDDLLLEPQRVLGSTIRALHAQPVLTSDVIEQARLANPATLGNSDLDQEIERVKFTPIALSLEELSKLWSVFFQIPYALSIAYQAMLVFVEADVTPRAVLPVRDRTITVLPFHTPQIDKVEPERPTAGGVLTLRGSYLAGEVTRVRVGEQLVAPTSVTPRAIAFTLPATLDAGVHAVQVVHQLLLGDPPTSHLGFESNVVPFMLLPTITMPAAISVAAGGTLTLDVSPPVRRGQRVAVLIGEHTLRRHVVDGEPESILQPQFEIPAGFAAGTYLLRIRVDGADSSLTVGATGLYDGPDVTIT